MREQHFYDFDRFRIDASERLLLRDGQIVPMTQKAFDVLLILVERRDRIVTKEELMSAVWPDTFVEEGNLAQNIYTLRKILGETPAGDDYIKTVPRRGYRFAAAVTETWGEDREREIPTGELRLLVDQKKEKLRDLFEAGDEVSVVENAPPNLFAAEESAAKQSAKVATAEAANQSASPSVWQKPRGKAIGIGVAALLAVIFGWLLFRSTRSPESARLMSIASLTNTGNISSVAISPDGKYVAYGVMDSPQRSSLWLRQLATSTSQQIVPPAELQYYLLNFTPDGKYIYYVTRTDRALYRIPLLGGPAKKLLERVERGVSFSPDGSQFVFRRHLPAAAE